MKYMFITTTIVMYCYFLHPPKTSGLKKKLKLGQKFCETKTAAEVERTPFIQITPVQYPRGNVLHSGAIVNGCNEIHLKYFKG